MSAKTTWACSIMATKSQIGTPLCTKCRLCRLCRPLLPITTRIIKHSLSSSSSISSISSRSIPVAVWTPVDYPSSNPQMWRIHRWHHFNGSFSAAWSSRQDRSMSSQGSFWEGTVTLATETLMRQLEQPQTKPRKALTRWGTDRFASGSPRIVLQPSILASVLRTQ